MRARDKAIIATAVRRHGPLSRVEIVSLAQLRPATISHLVRELLDEGTLEEAGLSDNPTGRKQTLLRVNERAGAIVALDFDAESVVAAVLDLHPRILGHPVREQTDLSGGVDALAAQLIRCARQAIENHGGSWHSVKGIGVGDPGIVDAKAGISVVASTIDFWRGVHLRERLELEFGLPVIVGNNTRNKALAERKSATNPGCRDMIFVEYGTGIGAGIVSGGNLLEGHRWAAGEFGHTHIVENGPPCKCGSFGCLEAIAGISALEGRIRGAIREGGHSQCLEMAEGEVEKITGWMVLEGAAKGDKMAAAIVEDLGNSLGLGIANLVNLFNPEIVILDQRLGLAGEALLDQIKRVVRRQALSHGAEALSYEFGKLGIEAGIIGAGLLVLEQIFEVPLLKPPAFLTAGFSRKVASRP